MTDIPAGFKPLFRTSPYLDAVGPFYSRGEGSGLVVALLAEEKHTNARGTVHGGVFATLADIALGYSAAFSVDPPLALITANLSLDYAGSAMVGDWIEARTDIQKIGRKMAFANAYISVGDERIVRASAAFLVGGKLETGKGWNGSSKMPDIG